MDNREIKSQEDILADIKRLSDEVKQNVASQQSLNLQAELGEEDLDTFYEKNAPNIVANPDLSHRLFYTMQSTLRKNLPRVDNSKPKTIDKENKNKAIRKLNSTIYAEKSLFLNRGKDIDSNGRRGSDQRQAYIDNFLKTAYGVVNKWVADGAAPWDLFLAFYTLNKEHGYRKDS